MKVVVIVDQNGVYQRALTNSDELEIEVLKEGEHDREIEEADSELEPLD